MIQNDAHEKDEWLPAHSLFYPDDNDDDDDDNDDDDDDNDDYDGSDSDEKAEQSSTHSFFNPNDDDVDDNDDDSDEKAERSSTHSLFNPRPLIFPRPGKPPASIPRPELQKEKQRKVKNILQELPMLMIEGSL